MTPRQKRLIAVAAVESFVPADAVRICRAKADGITVQCVLWQKDASLAWDADDAYDYARAVATPELFAACKAEVLGPAAILAMPWIDWRTIDFAEHIYAHEDFAALPALADMCEDRGCIDNDLLAHLRGRTIYPWRCDVCLQVPKVRCLCGKRANILELPHFRGCWALDRLRRAE